MYNGKLYIVTCRLRGSLNRFEPLSDTEYDARAVETELRLLKRFADPGLEFRKKCVFEGPMETLSARGHLALKH